MTKLTKKESAANSEKPWMDYDDNTKTWIVIYDNETRGEEFDTEAEAKDFLESLKYRSATKEKVLEPIKHLKKSAKV